MGTRGLVALRGIRFIGPVVAGTIVAAGLIVGGWASSAGAASRDGQAIAQLALANVGRHACARNSLGGRGYGSSCTGNGGRPEYWCADFAKWVWQNSGVADTQELTPAAGSFYTYGLRNGTLTALPAVGDAAVFNYYGGGVAEHVALVTAVYPNGTVETTSGDWGGQGGTEAQFSSTSRVVLNSPAYVAAVGKMPPPMGMVLSGFVAPVGVAVTPVLGGTEVADNSTLVAGQTIQSPNGLFSLGLSQTGALQETLGSRVLWTTGSAGQPNDKAELQSDGNLVLYAAAGQPLWSTGTGNNPGDSLWLRNDGSILILSSTGTVLWRQTPSTGIIPVGTTLTAGQELVADEGLYQLYMQRDGNLVEYSAGRALWTSGTAGEWGAFAKMYPSGMLAVLNPKYRALKAWGRLHQPGFAQLAPWGALVVRNDRAVLWSNKL